jgi:hypothetical protein
MSLVLDITLISRLGSCEKYLGEKAVFPHTHQPLFFLDLVVHWGLGVVAFFWGRCAELVGA